jgi:hypothetical protein
MPKLLSSASICKKGTVACPTVNLDAHSNSITRIFPHLGETGTTSEMIALLDRISA